MLSEKTKCSKLIIWSSLSDILMCAEYDRDKVHWHLSFVWLFLSFIPVLKYSCIPVLKYSSCLIFQFSSIPVFLFSSILMCREYDWVSGISHRVFHPCLVSSLPEGHHSPAVVEGSVWEVLCPILQYSILLQIIRRICAVLSMTIAENWMDLPNLPPQLMCTKVNFIYD